MKNNIWNKNMTALEKYQPELKNVIDEKKEEVLTQGKEPQIEVELSYTEEPITAITTSAGKYYLAGKYYPDGTSERMLRKYNDIEYGAVIFSMGLSDGRFLNKLAEHLKEEVTIIIYEPSLQLFIHTMCNYDCSVLLERKGVNWVIGDINEEYLEFVLSSIITVDNMLKVTPIVQANYEKIFTERIKYAVSILNKCIRKLRVEWNTWVKFSDNTISNTIKNAKYVYQHYSVNALFHTLPEDVPAIVVAAGPSLDKNIEVLKEAKGKACILACDTALKPLLRRGIVPDFFFVVDPSKPFELFDDPQVWKIPIVTGMNIPARIMENHKGKKILCKDNFFMLEMFEEVFGEHVNDPEHAMCDLPTGGSVATSAFSAARLMGAKTIVLVGQDLAMSGESEHAAGTFKKDRKLSEMTENMLEVVKDVYGQDVKTTKDFKYYLDWYGYEIEKYPELKVVDATEGGAFIKGTIISTLREVVDQYCVSEFDSEKYLQQLPLHFNEEEQKKALAFIQNVPKRFEKIKQKIRDGKKWYSELEKCAKKQDLSMKDVQKILKKVKNINLFMEEETLADLIVDGVKQEEYLIRTNLYNFQDDEQKNLLESAQMGLRFMERMEETIEKMWPDIEQLKEFSGNYK